MRKLKTGLVIVCLVCFCQLLYAFENKYTHPAITKEAVNNTTSQIDDYLKTQLGFGSGLTTELYWNFPSDIEKRIKAGDANPAEKTRTMLEWIKTGSNIEDEDGSVFVPPYRARHHFHDPYRNAGLDNHTDNPGWDAPFWSSWLPLGESALDWAIIGHSSYEPYNNHDKWITARNIFYHSLTEPNKASREAYLAESLMKLGCLLHLLEDMGVPAHTRNDFLFAHFRSATAFGNPLEEWVEQKIKNNGGNIPSSFLAGWTPTPQVFDKVSRYFDTDIYTGNYLGDGVPTPGTWGLSERTNYQFLSYSTIFRADDGTKYYFPHPDPCNTSPHIDSSWWYKRRYKTGYGITHLARTKYITKYAEDYLGTPYAESVIPYDTTFDKAIYNDYAAITLPRTINYAAGLVNYFFRGRLSVEAECIECDVFELTITNKSSNSGTPQTLKDGDFELYWEDAAGNRAEVPDCGIDGGWASSSTLAYDGTVTATFIKPTAGEPVKYILVYRGNICENPNQPDADDETAIAVTVFAPPSDNCCVVVGACCLPDADCNQITENDCAALGGYWLGEDTSCDDCYVEGAGCCNVYPAPKYRFVSLIGWTSPSFEGCPRYVLKTSSFIVSLTIAFGDDCTYDTGSISAVADSYRYNTDTGECVYRATWGGSLTLGVSVDKTFVSFGLEDGEVLFSGENESCGGSVSNTIEEYGGSASVR